MAGIKDSKALDLYDMTFAKHTEGMVLFQEVSGFRILFQAVSNVLSQLLAQKAYQIDGSTLLSYEHRCGRFIVEDFRKSKKD